MKIRYAYGDLSSEGSSWYRCFGSPMSESCFSRSNAAQGHTQATGCGLLGGHQPTSRRRRSTGPEDACVTPDPSLVLRQRTVNENWVTCRLFPFFVESANYVNAVHFFRCMNYTNLPEVLCKHTLHTPCTCTVSQARGARRKCGETILSRHETMELLKLFFLF